ncbi:mechanosensitive ion channel protein MscS [Orenia metallireducens]|uniref:Mechanosensitive ion channel protein MscS n=1 Tax=Orenia metallireducens TaxID=1413210 RepID=A0A1C0ACL2_9FIRM|nr:mechanosensitive ion channel family protein [Orenia metallireducens]OCL28111.1 mechanosensitive ion channel protein MscS [Orenia metallireducens]
MDFTSFDIHDPVIQKLLLSLGAIIITYLIGFGIIRFINSKIEDFKRRHQARRITYYSSFFIILIFIFLIWLERPSTLTTYLGFLSAGLALALHQVWLNIAGWALILLRRPFGLGDRIEWNQVQGDVIDIRVFYTTLLEVGNWVEADQSTGRLVHIPNSTIFNIPVFNYTRGFGCIWNEIRFLVSFESDWKRAKKIVLETGYEQSEEEIEARAKKRIYEMSKNYMIKYGKFTPITYVDIKGSGVQITLRYLTSVRKRRVLENNISESILEKFSQEPNIELAYPTSRVYRRSEEGRHIENKE